MTNLQEAKEIERDIKREEVAAQSVFIERSRRRMLSHNQHLVMTIVGGTGMGKSYCALRIAEILDPDFTIDQCVFSPDAVLLLAKTLKKGSVIILDEAGVGFASRDAMTRQNKTIGKFLQVWRARNLCLISTLPSLEMMDKQGQMLSHAVLRPMHIDRRLNKVQVRFLMIDHNPFTGVTLKQYMRKEGQRLTKLYVKLPSVKLRHEYEKKKAHFLDLFNEESHDKLTVSNVKEETRGSVSRADLIKMIEADKERFLSPRSKKYMGRRIFTVLRKYISQGDADILAYELNKAQSPDK